MSILTKNALSASNQASFPNNTTGAITPQILRDFNQDVIDTLVDSLNTGSYAITTGSNDFTQANSFTSISASSFVSASFFVGDGSKLTNVTASVAIPISDEGILQGYATQLNFSGSNISASLNAGIATISVNTNNLVTTSSFNSFTASVNTFTASQVTKNSTLATYTASVDTKFTAVGASTASLNAYTSSNNTKWTTLGNLTGSLSSSVDQLNSFSASQITKDTTLASYTGSNDTKWSSLGTQSGSWVTETESGSFLITASVSLNTITFTKGNNTTFAVTVNTGSGGGGDLTSLNAFTSSQQLLNTTFATTGSNTFTGTQIITAGQSLQTNRIIDNGADISIDGGMNGVIITSAGGKKTIIRTNTEITGAVNITGSLTASLQNGYAWVGNGSGITIAVPTSSIAGASINTGSFVTTSSFNDYTASQSTASLVTSINNLNTFTQSAQVSINALNSATSSYVTESETGSFATTGSNTFVGNQTITGNITAFSASFTYLQTIFESSSVIYSSGSNIFGDELSDVQTLSGSVKVQGSLTVNGTPVQTSSVDISALNSFTSSQLTINSAIGASTSSLNTFSASTLTRLTNIESTTASLNTSVAALNTFTSSQETKDLTLASVTSSLNSATASLFTSASLALVTASFDNGTRNLTFTKGNTTQFSVNIPDTSGSAGNFVTTSSFNSYTSSNDQKVNSLISATGSYATTGSNTFVGNQTLTGSLFISGNINMVNGADIVTHHVKAAGSNGLELQNASSGIIVSMGAGGGTQAAFTGAVTANSISASTITGIGNVTDYSTSVDSRLDQLEASTGSLFSSASLSLTTASFAGNTLTFRKGDGTTFGVVIPDVSGSTINTGSFATTGSNAFFGTNTFSGAVAFTGSAPNILSSSFSGSIITNLTDIYTDVAAVNQIVTLTSASYAALASGSLTNPNTLYIVSGSISGSSGATVSTSSLMVTGSVAGNVLTFTKGDASTFSLTVATGSGGGGAAFPYTGDAVITGSLQVTGSVRGNVVTLAVASNTASVDFTSGNIFTLTLPSGSTTHITPTNIKAGQTINIQITQQVGPSTGSVAFPPSVLFAGGYDYQATMTGSAKDVVSFIAFDGSNVVATSLKNLL